MTSRVWPHAALLLLAASATGACARRSVAVPSARHSWPVPVDDRGLSCADLSELRVCWTESDGVHLAPRPVPPVPASSPLGWRCTGDGSVRTCAERAPEVGAFTCASGRCVERHPRLPDDGEWSCADMAGAAVCAGGDSAAGLPKPARDPTWICGPERGKNSERQTGRVCVDLAPDFPDGVARGWRCSYAAEPGATRVCERDPNARQIGDRCNAAQPCIDGLICTEARCVPPRLTPSCAFDRECDSHRCRFGSCLNEAP